MDTEIMLAYFFLTIDEQNKWKKMFLEERFNQADILFT